MPRLDQRLKAVASLIRCSVHADIGSDHAHLLKALLASGRIERGIAVENKLQPFYNSQATLVGYNSEIRFGDGLEVLKAGEADSVSVCGMGGPRIVQILSAFPDRVPPQVVVQPNTRADIVREWGLDSGYHLVDEQIAHGHWPYQILSFSRRGDCPDSAYAGLDRNAALQFGPWVIRQSSSDFLARLHEERDYLRGLKHLEPNSQLRLEAIEFLLNRPAVYPDEP